ncbi:MAG TPA: hypothetical protein VF541_01585 [Longimicrobium sp.]|jgi:hypothetical protein
MRTRHLTIAAVLFASVMLGCSQSPTAPAASAHRPSLDGGVTVGSGNRDGVTFGSGNSVSTTGGNDEAADPTESAASEGGVTVGSGN